MRSRYYIRDIIYPVSHKKGKQQAVIGGDNYYFSVILSGWILRFLIHVLLNLRPFSHFNYLIDKYLF